MGMDNAAIRELTGPYAMTSIRYYEAEAGVAATTKLVAVDGLDAGDITMPWGGYIVGVGVGCEAGANFTLQVTVGGTPDTGVTLTVDSASEYVVLDYGDKVPFDAGDTIGAYVVADTTSRDVVVEVFVVLNVGG